LCEDLDYEKMSKRMDEYEERLNKTIIAHNQLEDELRKATRERDSYIKLYEVSQERVKIKQEQIKQMEELVEKLVKTNNKKSVGEQNGEDNL